MMYIDTENVIVMANSKNVDYDVAISHKGNDGGWHVERIELDLPDDKEHSLKPHQKVLYDIWCYALAQNNTVIPSSLWFPSERDMSEQDMRSSEEN
jgi:hypothetical protein